MPGQAALKGYEKPVAGPLGALRTLRDCPATEKGNNKNYNYREDEHFSQHQKRFAIRQRFAARPVMVNEIFNSHLSPELHDEMMGGIDQPNPNGDFEQRPDDNQYRLDMD